MADPIRVYERILEAAADDEGVTLSPAETDAVARHGALQSAIQMARSCTPYNAVRCPKCGRCTCVEIADSRKCPLHGDKATHAI